MTVFISSLHPPPADLLQEAIESNDLEPLEHWFIQQKNTGYSFQTIADFVEERRSAKPKSKSKRAPAAKPKTRSHP